MSTTPLVQPHHLRRKAVIYIRQSTGHQVLTNTESQKLQHAMRDHAHQLGADKNFKGLFLPCPLVNAPAGSALGQGAEQC